MMGGGGGKMAWMAGGIVTEDEGDEGLCGAEELFPSLVIGDEASGVRGCNTDGSKTSLDAKVSDRVLPRFGSGKGSRSTLDKLSGFPEEEKDLLFGVLLAELEMEAFCLNNFSGLSKAAESFGFG
jgi:hypothetical protein